LASKRNPPPISIPQTGDAVVNRFNLDMKNALTGLWRAYYGDLIVPTDPPATAASTGVAGTMTWDSSYIYVCVATDTWKRVAIATW
jgi:sensor domain CHASE-containing protein